MKNEDGTYYLFQKKDLLEKGEYQWVEYQNGSAKAVGEEGVRKKANKSADMVIY